MHDERTSLELLAHFDDPKTRVTIDGVTRHAPQSRPVAQRDIRWVLKWAIATAIMTVATGILTEFAYILAAEQQLNAAARAGASEASLPRATTESVRAAVERRLGNQGMAHDLQITIVQNGQPVQRQIRQHEADRFEVSLSLPTSNVVPKWVRMINPSHNGSLIRAHAQRQVPSRKLAYRASTHAAAE